VAIDLYALELAGGTATVRHRPAARADVVIAGTARAWTRALGPERARDGLRVEGDGELAELFLASFRAPAAELR
jgi:hypothetical protein